MKKLEFIRLLSSWSLFAGCLMLMNLTDVWAGCTVGDEKCGADGYVLKCHSGVLCTLEGGSYDQNCWYREVLRKCTNKVCEPGIRRCRAGYVQECDYHGARWVNVKEIEITNPAPGFDEGIVYEVNEKCEGHDFSED